MHSRQQRVCLTHTTKHIRAPSSGQGSHRTSPGQVQQVTPGQVTSAFLTSAFPLHIKLTQFSPLQRMTGKLIYSCSMKHPSTPKQHNFPKFNHTKYQTGIKIAGPAQHCRMIHLTSMEASTSNTKWYSHVFSHLDLLYIFAWAKDSSSGKS